MDIEDAVRGSNDAKEKLRSPKGISDPATISEQMVRLTMYTSAIEDELAKLEEKYEIDMAAKLHDYQVDKQLSANASENMARMDLGSLKGRIAFLTRIVGSGWKTVASCQSRFKHLESELGLGRKHIT